MAFKTLMIALPSMAVTPGDPLGPRRADPECSFAPKLDISAWKHKDDDNGKPACIGWVTSGATCKPWPDKHFEDLKEVVQQQATKDGQFKTSEVGHWLAGFQLITTAVANRTKFAENFNYLLDSAKKDPKMGNWKQGGKSWYYSYDSEFINIKWSTGFGDSCPDE